MRNFGDQSVENPAEGFLEEIGEFCHAHLKMKQGIRGTVEEHYAAMADAIGDAVIYLGDFCYRANFLKSFVGRDLLSKELASIEAESRVYWVACDPMMTDTEFLYKAAEDMGYLLMHKEEELSLGIYVECILERLRIICSRNKIGFTLCVEGTWGQVKQRDWRKNDLTGDATQ
jgi:hypothetical protein